MFPKTCYCGITHTDVAWKNLVLVGYQRFEETDHEPEMLLELRNCKCGSTLMISIATENQ